MFYNSDLFINLIRFKGATTIAEICQTISSVSNIINIIIFALINILYFSQYFHGIIGFFTKAKKWPEAKKNHKYGYLISARDEEQVIGHLIDSIYEQDYPRELMQVFVIADNCSDNTANVAKEHGAIVIKRNNKNQIGKGFALNYGFKKIFANHDYDDFEAFFIFDADNLVSKNYTYEMNKVYDSGEKISTSFRDSKNFGDSWVSAGQSISFFREALLIHHSRSKLNMGTYISGTGFFIDRNLLLEIGGWNFFTLIEDVEFSLYCAEQGIKIEYCEAAVFYDEQPVSLKDSLYQRLRWCKGTHQCCAKYEGRLFKRWITSGKPIAFEMMMHVNPLPLIGFVWTIIYILLNTLIMAVGMMAFNDYIRLVLITCVGFVGGIFFAALIQAFLCMIKRHKHIHTKRYKKILYCFTFPLFMTFYLPLLLVAQFKKVDWRHIPHTDAKSIELIDEVVE